MQIGKGGKTKSGGPGPNEELVVHETLAVLAFDEQAKKYEFRTYLASGSQGEYELKLIDGGWQWGLPAQGGSVRFTFKLTDKGEWFEIGEFSQDGKTWRKFMEFTLSRVP